MKNPTSTINHVDRNTPPGQHVIKIAKPGYDVTDLNKERAVNYSKKKILPHLLSALALPYLIGARRQVIRYLEVASTLENNSIVGTQGCIHEVSTLFEDLNTVGKYMKKCGKENELHKLWLDVRNHIRHDIREELDNESREEKISRAKNLKLHPKLQMSMGFTVDHITVGGTNIEIKQITNYLNWADDIITSILEEAKKKGFYKSN